jgi:electron transport complex protein RnfD
LNNTAPYIHTDENYNSRAKDWLIALLPVLIWSVYMFGARVITLVVLGALFSLALDYSVRRFVFRLDRGARFDLNAAVYGVLAVFTMPVAVPLWFPTKSGMQKSGK